MEDRCRQTCINLRKGVEKGFKMIDSACSARCDDRYVYRIENGIEHFKVEALLHAVGINGVNHDFTCTAFDTAFYPLNGFHSRVIPAASENPNVRAELICDGLHVHPSMVRVAFKLFPGRIVLVSDALCCCGMPDGEYDLGGQPIFLKGIECRLADGTIAGSVLKLNHAVRNVLANTTLPVNEVFKMASLNPATSIRVADRIGSLEAGKDADIIIVDNEINVLRTIKKGRTIYEA